MNGFTAESALTRGDNEARLDLATALGVTPGGVIEQPVFFSGFLTRPDVAAAGILTVADVAMARYADAGLAQRLANLDPIVTASGDRMRFESFSACNGVHARFDLLANGVDSGEISFGTTNVDINQPLRTALTRVDRNQLLHLAVGSDALTASTPEDTHVERKVGLPERWVRGCAEVPSIAAAMKPAATLRGTQITRFLGDLPTGSPPGPSLHLVTVSGSVRTTAHRLPGSVAITGTSRLKAAARISRYATELTLYAGPKDTSGWVFDVPGGRLTLLLSPGPYRGFSGEGGLLSLLAGPTAARDGESLLEHLAWTPVIDEARLVAATGLPPQSVRTGLAWLAASGRVGFDLAEQARFHRDLPVDGEKVLRRNPRLAGARRLLERGAVTADGPAWLVTGDRDTYRVRGCTAHARGWSSTATHAAPANTCWPSRCSASRAPTFGRSARITRCVPDRDTPS